MAKNLQPVRAIRGIGGSLDGKEIKFHFGTYKNTSEDDKTFTPDKEIFVMDSTTYPPTIVSVEKKELF